MVRHASRFLLDQNLRRSRLSPYRVQGLGLGWARVLAVGIGTGFVSFALRPTLATQEVASPFACSLSPLLSLSLSRSVSLAL